MIKKLAENLLSITLSPLSLKDVLNFIMKDSTVLDDRPFHISQFFEDFRYKFPLSSFLILEDLSIFFFGMQNI